MDKPQSPWHSHLMNSFLERLEGGLQPYTCEHGVLVTEYPCVECTVPE